MESMDLLRHGGIPVYLLLCWAFMSHPIGLVALLLAFTTRSRPLVTGFGGLALALGLGSILVGIGGYLYGMSQVENALAFADPESRDELYAMGRSEAMISTWVGLVSSALPLLLGAGAVARGATLAQRPVAL